MPLLPKILKILAWTAGCLAGLCALLYLVLVIVNWRDAEPSATALRMAEIHRNRPAVRDEDNAFVYVMGFDVAPGEDPLEMGRKRIAWIQEAKGWHSLDGFADPLVAIPDHAATRHEVVSAYLEACKPTRPDCSDAFEAAAARIGEWQASEKWLLERYQALLDRPAWREFVSTQPAAPFPGYTNVMDGQKLLIAHARSRAAQGSAADVREMLGHDLRFWRRVLESSDLLITKVVAAGAIVRHLKLGAIVIRILPPERAHAAVPPEWDVAITDAERSMRRSLIGEWIFSSGMLRDMDHEMPEATLADDPLATLTAPFFQAQDTNNRFAEFLSRAAEITEGIPLAEYDAATQRVTEMSAIATRDAWPPRSLYNIPGQMLLGLAGDYGKYTRRVGDIEGVRRAALAAVRLHAAAVAPENMSAALASSELRSPYDDRPFGWDAAEQAIVFRGLEPGERGDHRIWIH